MEDWRDRFLLGAENALRRRPRDEEALKDEQIKKLKQKIGDLALDNDLSRRKLPRQGDRVRGELLTVWCALHSDGVIPSNVPWGRSSLYSRIHAALISRTWSSDSNT